MAAGYSSRGLIYSQNGFEYKGDYITYEMDSCIVGTHIMLEATNLRIDNIWIESYDEKIFKEKFGIPNELPFTLNDSETILLIDS